MADILVREGFVKVSLADPIKRICKDVFAFTDEQLWGPSEKRNAPDPRYLRRVAGQLGSIYLGDMNLKGTIYEEYASLVQGGHLPNPPRDEYLTPRYALQKLGTEWGRDCYGPVWIDYVVRVAKEICDGGFVYRPQVGLESEYGHPNAPRFPARGVVIPDVRFKNEVRDLTERGAIMVRIKRTGLEAPAFDHPSETEQIEIPDGAFHSIIGNTAGLGLLHETTLRMLSELLVRRERLLGSGGWPEKLDEDW